MRRSIFSDLWIPALLLALTGCAGSDNETPEPALGDQPGQWMPPQQPAADLSLLADQTNVKLLAAPKIEYGPLGPAREIGAKLVSTEASQSNEPAAPANRGKSAGASPAGGRKHTKVGSALSGMMGLVSGRHRPAASAPPRVSASPGQPGATAPPASAMKGSGSKKPPPVRLVERKEENKTIPPCPSKHSKEEIESVKAAAMADATRKLVQSVFALPLDPATAVAEAVGHGPEDFAGTLPGQYQVSAHWSGPATLEIELQITIGQTVTALSKTYDGVMFDSLRGLGEDKAVEARGSATISGAKDDNKSRMKVIGGGIVPEEG